MKDEIKEILEDNGELMVRYKDNSFECFDTLPKNVLDYIINLQKEYEIELDENLKLSEWLVKKQKRIDKAIEYIRKKFYIVRTDNNEFELDLYLKDNDVEYLLNILNGDDNN